MRFLGIRNGHDQNITYTDGYHIKYIKLERNLQLKHYNYIPIYPEVIEDDIPKLFSYIQKEHSINPREMDAICINVSNDVHRHTDKQCPKTNEVYKKLSSKTKFWNQFKCPVYTIDHHYAHVLSCWPLVDIEKIKNNFVIDGEGDHQRHTSVFHEGKLIDFIDSIESVGLSKVMEQFGASYGMDGMKLDLSGKMMALNAFHNVPTRIEKLLHLWAEPFHYRHFKQLAEICGQPSLPFREYCKVDGSTEHEQGFINASYFAQRFSEIKIPKYFDLYVKDHSEVITYSGGTAQNTCVNSKIIEAYPNVVIPPHCPDDGISLGCVEFLRQLYGQDPFDTTGFPYWQSDEAPESVASKKTIDKTANLLAKGKIVGWYQGNGEIGPRALGNRSILMDPSVENGKDILNEKVKHREPYRPFGASILREHSEKLFDFKYDSPYMLYVTDIKGNGFPSVSHVDRTCRIQTVAQEPQYETYYSLIDTFRKKTGIPMLLNTSLNVNGKPIAGHIKDAKELFETSQMDALVVGDEIVTK